MARGRLIDKIDSGTNQAPSSSHVGHDVAPLRVRGNETFSNEINVPTEVTILEKELALRVKHFL